MADVVVDIPFTGTAAGGATVALTVTLQAGRQYRIDLQDTDGGPFEAALSVFAAGQPHGMETWPFISYILGRMDAGTRPSGTLYFTPPTDGDYEIDIAQAATTGFRLTVHEPALAQDYILAPQDFGATRVDGTPGDDLVELGNFATYNRLMVPSGAPVASGGAGFDVLVVDGILDSREVVQRGDGAHLQAVYPQWGTSTPHFFDDTVIDVRLEGIEAVQFNDTVLYTLAEAQAQVARLYEGALDRAPEIAGLASHLALQATGATLLEVAHGFLASPEFGARSGTLADDAFIATLYRNALGREPEAGGLAFYEAMLANGGSRETVLVGISNSPEAQALATGIVVV